MYFPSDVILAVASPPGISLRGIIRASGKQTFALLGECVQLSPIQGRPHSHILENVRMSEPPSWKRGVYTARVHAINNNMIAALALVMPAPHSYTGEDSAELQLTGNPALLQRIVDQLLQSAKQRNIPARRAHPGEFTARAFFNNKLTLTQAEGVAATIAAQSDAELRAAHVLSSGSLGAFAHDLADALAGALALVEAGIDFTDQDDVVAISPADLHQRLLKLHRRVDDQLKRAVGMEQLEAIPWVVLRGAPNAGKSSLFNAMLGHERAVVSPTSGTTRDVLAEPLTISTPHGPAEVMLVDLAGLDENDSSINRLMQSAARDALDRAELVLHCVPIDENIPDLNEGEVLVRTKADLSHTATAARGFAHGPNAAIQVSALNQTGLNELRTLVAHRLSSRAVSLAADATALRPRHEHALQSARNNLAEAIELVAPVESERSLAYPELIASTMRGALNDLAALAGDITPDDVLGRVFATFCVGK